MRYSFKPNATAVRYVNEWERRLIQEHGIPKPNRSSFINWCIEKAGKPVRTKKGK